MEILNSLDKEIASGLSITKNEFSHLSYDKNYNIGLFFRENKNKTDIITYGFGYDYRKYNPTTLCKESFRAGIHFKEVDRILYRILGGKTISKDIFFYSSHEVTIKEILAPDITTDTQHTIVFADSIIKEKELERVVAETDSFINRYYIPFFSEFQSLQDINDKILEKEEFSNYYKYIFGETGAKVLIIMKLCNSNKYQEYKKWSDNIIAKQIADPMYEDYKDILINQQATMDKLYNYLESGAYKNLLKE
ncbi:hypothetical protein HUE46_02260 [Flavobacterium columnare]|uniref:hypothetical protein n=1 Tax=Flavobacterium columnare TaxID=996 RepID=UPI00177DDFBD|nr:hypothetical protein [Flavobacterium columnare]QOG88938.1 hypothetical protein HUE41_02260 [Flavobacterium columnare]QOG91597.1 hypothetical protein HUE42_02255 [Flavobacterium columnare]QOG94260.1 hypothetical protein HUE43_02260 [Flavobacterium columnare]QOG96919.1 hypothetical protein HUE44_02255 [Flavobacterium columnare]QOG99577.1 hypothetical protein HUE45_02255 [Flavobacterium columnare]